MWKSASRWNPPGRGVIARTRERVSAGDGFPPGAGIPVLGGCFSRRCARFTGSGAPTLKDNRSDFPGFMALKKSQGMEGISVDSHLLRKLPFLLRQSNGK